MEKQRTTRAAQIYEEAAKIGQKLKEHREAQKLSLQELAPLVGMTHQNLSKIERGVVNTPYETLVRIAKRLGVKLADLLAETWAGGGERDVSTVVGLRQELHTIVLFKEDLDKRIDALQSRLAKIGKAPYQGLDDSVLVPSFPPFWNTVYAR